MRVMQRSPGHRRDPRSARGPAPGQRSRSTTGQGRSGSIGANAATGNAGDEMIEPHHEADDEENQTNGHEELFAVMTGHAVFTVDGEPIDAPAGTIVFVRDPALIRSARAAADDTAIFMVGGPVGVPYTVSRWEVALP